jgi:large subunit ribosomal protein L18
MATGPRYFVRARRRREGKTNYYQRMGLIVSDRPRMVVRKTNRAIIIQLVTAYPEGDRTLVTANSRDLSDLGYTGPRSNLPAAYLTGLLFAARAKKAGYGEAVLDLGLHRATRGARIFAALKGAVEGGLEIPHSEEILPDDARVRGEHIAAHAPEQGARIKEQVAQVAERIAKGVE